MTLDDFIVFSFSFLSFMGNSFFHLPSPQALALPGIVSAGKGGAGCAAPRPVGCSGLAPAGGLQG